MSSSAAAFAARLRRHCPVTALVVAQKRVTCDATTDVSVSVSVMVVVVVENVFFHRLDKVNDVNVKSKKEGSPDVAVTTVNSNT